MNELRLIDEREVLGKPFSIYGDIECPLFLAKDVAVWIDHSNVSAMLKMVADDEKVLNNVYTLGGAQEMWFLTEDGVYEVLMQSNKPIAKTFKREVKIILRSIRKHGGYLTPEKVEEALLNPDVLIKLANTIKAEREARIKAESKVVELIPKANFFDAVANSRTALPFDQVAKVLDYPGVGRNTLFSILREQGVLQQNNVPYQQYIDRGYFRVIEQHFTKPNGENVVSIKTLVYQRGVDYIRKLLDKSGLRTSQTRPKQPIEIE